MGWLTNTFVVGGEPTPRQVELFEICMGALEAGEALLCPDVPAAQLTPRCGAISLHNGLDGDFPSHTGHGPGPGASRTALPGSGEHRYAPGPRRGRARTGTLSARSRGDAVRANYLITDRGHETLTRHQLALTPRGLPHEVMHRVRCDHAPAAVFSALRAGS